ncbi:hypothetical protein AHAS_Ahas17G0174900 [Arachis hypogaea]
MPTQARSLFRRRLLFRCALPPIRRHQLLFQKICINFTAWGYTVFTADLLDHGRSDSERA